MHVNVINAQIYEFTLKIGFEYYINDEQVTFNVYKDFQFTSRDNTCFSINAIDRFVDVSVQDNKYVDPFDRHLVQG